MKSIASLPVFLMRFHSFRRFIGYVFAHMIFALPVHTLRETPNLIAFHHPRPSYSFHVLIIPKRAIASLLDLTPGDEDFVFDAFQVVQSLVLEFGLQKSGYRLVVNGGSYQEIPQLHFHLISDIRIASK